MASGLPILRVACTRRINGPSALAKVMANLLPPISRAAITEVVMNS